MSACWESLINASESEPRYLLHQNYKEESVGADCSLSAGCTPTMCVESVGAKSAKESEYLGIRMKKENVKVCRS